MNSGHKKQIVANRAVINNIKESLGMIQEELQEQYDEMSEKVQEGEKGEELAANITAIEEAVGSLEEAEEKLTEVVGE